MVVSQVIEPASLAYSAKVKSDMPEKKRKTTAGVLSSFVNIAGLAAARMSGGSELIDGDVCLYSMLADSAVMDLRYLNLWTMLQ